MYLISIQVQVTPNLQLFHDLLVPLRCSDRNEIVSGSKKHNRWRSVLVNIVHWRELLPVLLNTVITIAARTVVEYRIE